MTCEGPSLKIGYCHWATQMSTKNVTQSLQTVILIFQLADELKCLQKTYSNVLVRHARIIVDRNIEVSDK